MKSGVQCKSDDELLGEYSSLIGCSNVCRKTNGCNFFQYGKDNKKGKCLWEKTSEGNCSQGWEDDDSDFYELLSKVPYVQPMFQLYELKVLHYIVTLILSVLINSRASVPYYATETGEKCKNGYGLIGHEFACREAAKFVVDTNSEFEDWDQNLEWGPKNTFEEGNDKTAGCYWNMQGHYLWYNPYGVEGKCVGPQDCRTICEKKGLQQIYTKTSLISMFFVTIICLTIFIHLKILIGIGECPSIKVLDTTDDGKYFVFASGNFEKMIELEDWHGKKIKIHKSQSALDGVAKFWNKNSDGISHFHGRWDDPAPEKQQWKKGDEIVFQSCKCRLENSKSCNGMLIF